MEKVRKRSLDRTFIPPCQEACPLHQEIREYVDLIAQGRIMEALKVIREGNPFPSICAYICPHKCEEKCRRGKVDSPIAIRALKRFAVEFGGDRMIRLEAQTVYEEKIAIVGSGPAGLSAAYYLRRLGYPVTIFEAYKEAGGMLRLGIPQFRLPKEMLDLEIERLIQMGVEIRTNTPVISLDLLFKTGYKAVFVTVGAQQGRRLGIEGEEMSGVMDGISFLKEVNLGLRPRLKGKVIVVGGGGVAMDCALAAVRLGAEKVEIVCLEKRYEMPAGKEEIAFCEEEGITIHTGFGVKRFKGGAQGVQGVELVRCISVFDENKRFNPKFDESETAYIDADTVVFAVGQMPRVPEDFRLDTGKAGTIKVDPVTLTTNRDGVFAGGDAVTGPSSVVEALATGRKAAFRIDDYLRHRYPLEEKFERPVLKEEMKEKTVETIRKMMRIEPTHLPREERASKFEPFELVYDWESAMVEAKRCLRCGMGAEIVDQEKCASCLTCLRTCPYGVPFVDETGAVKIPPSDCVACGICVSICPAKVIFLRKPSDRRHIDEELSYLKRTIDKAEKRPLIVGFCCQYGLFGTGSLSYLFKGAQAGIQIVPVLCIGKVEVEHILKAFELMAEGVFISGCGEEQCARENTTFFACKKANRAKKILEEIGLEGERIEVFNPAEKDLRAAIEGFLKKISTLLLEKCLKEAK